MMTRDALLKRARAAALHAYAPYSGFRVGAAVVVSGHGRSRVVTGANVENASFGLTLCAERAALAAALTSANGSMRSAAVPWERPQITQIAVACIDAQQGTPTAQCTPCGACRQWLAELAPDATYYLDGLPGAYHLDDLLPLAFRLPAHPPHLL
jgi:cytidine deaminase